MSELPIWEFRIFFFFSNFQVYVGLYCAGHFDFVRRALLINLINSVASWNNTVGILRRDFFFFDLSLGLYFIGSIEPIKISAGKVDNSVSSCGLRRYIFNVIRSSS